MKFLQWVCFILLPLAASEAQENLILQSGIPIEVDVMEDGRIVYAHTILKGQTIYSLARTFQSTTYDVLKKNNLPNGTPLSIGQVIEVDLPLALIYRGYGIDPSDVARAIPIYYTVKAKENLFRIARIYFNQDVDVMIKRNGKSDSNLSVNERLLIGWLPLGGELKTDMFNAEQTEVKVNVAESDLQEEIPGDETLTMVSEGMPGYILSSDKPDSVVEAQAEILPLRQTRGIAIWDKKSSSLGNMYVMHHTARINSEIELYNPTIRRTVKAKVVGRIPTGTYPSDVSLIITPRVADALGALDSRFMVEMKYTE